jgi:hypothetical protein
MQFHIDPPIGRDAEIIYKVATTRSELEQAFTLIQESYVEMKLTVGDPLSMRLSKYNALPTTLVFIAVYKGRVIATMSQIMDTALGLPIESFSSIEILRDTGKRISEISGLAIAKEWRSRSTGVFFPLSSFAILYGQKFVGVDYFVIVTRARVRFFYQALYNFEPIEDKVKKHSGVNQKKSFAQYVKVENLNSFYKDKFDDNKCGFNLFHIYSDFPAQFPWLKQIRLPSLKYNICSNQLFDSNDLFYFFLESSAVLSTMSKEDLRVLKSIYRFTSGEKILGKNLSDDFEGRTNQRFIVNLVFKFRNKSSGAFCEGKVIEISKGGFAVLFQDVEHTTKKLEGVIHLNSVIKTGFRASACWTNGVRVGYKITEINNEKWKDIIHYCCEYSCHELSYEFEIVA